MKSQASLSGLISREWVLTSHYLLEVSGWSRHIASHRSCGFLSCLLSFQFSVGGTMTLLLIAGFVFIPASVMDWDSGFICSFLCAYLSRVQNICRDWRVPMWEYNSTIMLLQQECYWWEERGAMYSEPSAFSPVFAIAETIFSCADASSYRKDSISPADLLSLCSWKVWHPCVMAQLTTNASTGIGMLDCPQSPLLFWVGGEFTAQPSWSFCIDSK